MKLAHSIAKWFIHTVGRTSQGIRLCLEEGLTSGKVLDYVYRNRAEGSFFVGSWIDRLFLDNPGWQAVRTRRRHLEKLLAEAITSIRTSGKAVKLVDVASGPAVYIISVLLKMGDHDVTAICRDLDERWLVEGRAACDAQGVTSITFERGDAFKIDEVAITPNIVVVSGFYDWIVDDARVKESLVTIHELLEQGGYIVLTNQVAHPNLEFVQDVFSDFSHNPLRMKMRPEALIQSWLEEAHFEVETTLKDDFGYYSITKARKR